MVLSVDLVSEVRGMVLVCLAYGERQMKHDVWDERELEHERKTKNLFWHLEIQRERKTFQEYGGSELFVCRIFG